MNIGQRSSAAVLIMPAAYENLTDLIGKPPLFALSGTEKIASRLPLFWQILHILTRGGGSFS